jgi:hypothetical protein
MNHFRRPAMDVIVLVPLRVGICPGWPFSANTRQGMRSIGNDLD